MIASPPKKEKADLQHDRDSAKVNLAAAPTPSLTIPKHEPLPQRKSGLLSKGTVKEQTQVTPVNDVRPKIVEKIEPKNPTLNAKKNTGNDVKERQLQKTTKSVAPATETAGKHTEVEIPATKPEKKPVDKFSPIKRKAAPEPESAGAEETVKRRRGRPKKTERVVKEKVVTRKSSRITDKPELALKSKASGSSVGGPKPLRVLNLDQLLSPSDTSDSSNSPIVATNPTEIEFKRFGITPLRLHYTQPLSALDVLLQFVKEHSPRPKVNDTINEEIILSEYKLNLLQALGELQGMHSCIFDISNDILDVQRKKNDTRRKILELQKKHTYIKDDIAEVRESLEKSTREYDEFMSLVGSFKQLQQAISDDRFGTSLDACVQEDIESYLQLFDQQWGLAARLKSVNASLRAMLNTDQE